MVKENVVNNIRNNIGIIYNLYYCTTILCIELFGVLFFYYFESLYPTTIDRES